MPKYVVSCRVSVPMSIQILVARSPVPHDEFSLSRAFQCLSPERNDVYGIGMLLNEIFLVQGHEIHLNAQSMCD
jgi:hypothetical protein